MMKKLLVGCMIALALPLATSLPAAGDAPTKVTVLFCPPEGEPADGVVCATLVQYERLGAIVPQNQAPSGAVVVNVEIGQLEIVHTGTGDRANVPVAVPTFQMSQTWPVVTNGGFNPEMLDRDLPPLTVNYTRSEGVCQPPCALVTRGLVEGTIGSIYRAELVVELQGGRTVILPTRTFEPNNVGGTASLALDLDDFEDFVLRLG